MRSSLHVGLFLTLFGAVLQLQAAEYAGQPWRQAHRIIDLHQHITCSTQYLQRAVKLMDGAGLGIAVNLSGGTVIPRPTEKISSFERNKALAEKLYPGRFLHYMNLDYAGWDEPDFAARAVRQIEEGHRLGAAGFKEYKRLGLSLRNRAGELIQIDDSKLDPMWKRCGELNLPVTIHVGDPKAFWLPYSAQNERWKELKDHRAWWFGDTNRYPARKSLLEALNRVIARHPETTFVCAHFANNAEELDWVDQSLSRYPNMMADLAARIPELGRQATQRVREILVKHQDRIVFGTDFMVDSRLILGSSGDEPPPTDADALVFFQKHWRWLETKDRDWEHMTPIQGDWRISSVGLPDFVLRKLYFDNARRILAHSMPLPEIRCRFVPTDFEPGSILGRNCWPLACASTIDLATAKATAQAPLETRLQTLFSSNYLYLRFECPFTKLSVFEPAWRDRERVDRSGKGSLWDRDVVEAFIATDPGHLRTYAEFQVAPTNERLDVHLKDGKRDFDWNSGFDSFVQVDTAKKLWVCEIRIPVKAFRTRPQLGTVWRANFFRCDRVGNALLAWNPSLTGSFHEPERFGIVRFTE